jgi:hypothetical protein
MGINTEFSEVFYDPPPDLGERQVRAVDADAAGRVSLVNVVFHHLRSPPKSALRPNGGALHHRDLRAIRSRARRLRAAATGTR